MNYITGFAEFLKPNTIYRHWFRPRKAKNLDLDNKKILITGGNKGIGLETVRYIAEFANNSTVTVCASIDKVTLQGCCRGFFVGSQRLARQGTSSMHA